MNKRYNLTHSQEGQRLQYSVQEVTARTNVHVCLSRESHQNQGSRILKTRRSVKGVAKDVADGTQEMRHSAE